MISVDQLCYDVRVAFQHDGQNMAVAFTRYGQEAADRAFGMIYTVLNLDPKARADLISLPYVD
jgi:hypothetical protein